jgi:hypothetical protein
MPEQTVIVWDLETVPDLTAAARMLDLGMAPEAEVREALGRTPSTKSSASVPLLQAVSRKAGVSMPWVPRIRANDPKPI